MNAVDTLLNVLIEKRGCSYTCGWLRCLLKDLPRELKLTKKQVAALETVLNRNVKWVEALD